MRRHPVAVLAFLCAVLACRAALGEDSKPCNANVVVVQRGDTLSRLADRCEVSEGSILAANPGIDGSMDLQTGQKIRVSEKAESGQGIGSTLNDFANQADEAVNRVADRVGSSVQDLLDKNPDLRSRLEKLGRSIGIGEGATKATVAVTPGNAVPGSTVKVSGVGWPRESAVVIGGGAPGTAYEVLRTIRTSSSGTFDAPIEVPSWAVANEQFVFTAKADNGVHARSQRLWVSQ